MEFTLGKTFYLIRFFARMFEIYTNFKSAKDVLIRSSFGGARVYECMKVVARNERYITSFICVSLWNFGDCVLYSVG